VPEYRVEMITIDGSAGEGGGQILRTAVALALCERRPKSPGPKSAVRP
jgi:hypothetical protein